MTETKILIDAMMEYLMRLVRLRGHCAQSDRAQAALDELRDAYLEPHSYGDDCPTCGKTLKLGGKCAFVRLVMR